MLWNAEIVLEGLTVQKIVDALAALLEKIFAYIIKEEEWA